jgi:hypothetical protein
MSKRFGASMNEEASNFSQRRLTYTQWLNRVDGEVNRLTGGAGMTRKDFADWRFLAAFYNGIKPIDAAILMLSRDSAGRRYLEALGIEAANSR